MLFNHIMIQEYVEEQAIEVIEIHFIQTINSSCGLAASCLLQA